MKTVLCFGDSNTWGADPRDISRFPYQVRWPTALQRSLGEDWLVIPEGLSNRTTGFDDPLIPERNGRHSFAMVADSHTPLDWVVVMLGTNDAKHYFSHSPEEAAMAVGEIAEMAQERGAKALIVAPVPLTWPIRFSEFDEQSVAFSERLANLYQAESMRRSCSFLDAGSLIRASELDGVHLDEAAHERLGTAVATLLMATGV